MNSKLFSISICVLVATQGSLFSMRSITSKIAPRAANSIAAMTGASRAFDKNWKNVRGGEPDDKYLKKNRQWLKNLGVRIVDPAMPETVVLFNSPLTDYELKIQRRLEYFMAAAGVTAGVTAGAGMIYAKKSKEKASEAAKKEMLDGTDDVATVDSDLYKVILRIKKDIGISDNVPVRIAKKGFAPKYFGDKDTKASARAYYSSYLDCIVLSHKYRSWNKSSLIATLVHEFEHYRQYHKYHGSYGSDFEEKDNLKLETGADAAAAGYFDCPKCLKELQETKGIHAPYETDEGYFSSPGGYFSNDDYQPYIDRVMEDCELCHAHEVKKSIDKELIYKNINTAIKKIKDDARKRHKELAKYDAYDLSPSLLVRVENLSNLYGVAKPSKKSLLKDVGNVATNVWDVVVDPFYYSDKTTLKDYLPKEKRI